MADDRPSAFVDLWDRWKDPFGNWLEIFALVSDNKILASGKLTIKV